MTGKTEPEYTITIEYDEFITRLDLDEILRSIDRIIETELIGYFDPIFDSLNRKHPPFFPYLKYWKLYEPEFTYLGIRSITAGSFTLEVIIGLLVVKYVAKRFKKGVDETLLAEEIVRSGRITGDFMSSVLSRINNWAEKYVPKQRELGGNVKKITVKPMSKDNDGDKKKS